MRKGGKKWKRFLSLLLTAAMVVTGSGVQSISADAKEVFEETIFDGEAELSETSIAESEPETGMIEADEKESEAASSEIVSGEEKESSREILSESSEEQTSEVYEKEDSPKKDNVVEDKKDSEIENISDKKVVDNNEAEPNTTGNIINGDFEASWEPDGWTIVLGDGAKFEIRTDEWATNNKTKFLKIFETSNDCNVNISQTIGNVKAGNYKVSLQYDGDTGDGLFLYVKSGGNILASKGFGDGPGWDTWNDVITDKFSIDSDDTEITIEISGIISEAGKYIDLDNIKLETVPDKYTKAQLEKLYSKYREKDYTPESWESSGMKSAMESAKAILDASEKTDENSADEINDAYEAVEAAAGELIMADLSYTLYVYSDSEISGKASVWNEDAMRSTDFVKASKRSGWYYADFEIAADFRDKTNETNGFGFEIISCGYNSWGQKTFTKMLSGDADTYYMKKIDDKWEIWEDDTIMNTISFSIYNENDKLYLLCEDESGVELNQKSNDGWFMVSDFVVPAAGFKISTGSGDDNVIASFNSDGQLTDNSDETLFKGFTWYVCSKEKNLNRLFSDKESAVSAMGIELSDLEALLDNVQVYLDNASKYSDESIDKLKKAVNEAKILIDGNSTDSDEIKSAYHAVMNAVNALEERVISITLYYYKPDLGDKGLGISFWEGKDYLLSSSPSNMYDLGWEALCYEFEAVNGFTGWYAINLKIKDGAYDNTNGFGIYVIDKEAMTGSQIQAVEPESDWSDGIIFKELVSYK